MRNLRRVFCRNPRNKAKNQEFWRFVYVPYPQNLIIIVIALTCLITGFASGLFVGNLRGIPFVTKKRIWSIGIYMGESIFNFNSPAGVNNPVLAARDVTDVAAAFVADPFMVNNKNTWYMFFEVMNKQTKQGDIGLAISLDGMNWTYKQIVLDEPFHLSYPYVFKWEDDYFMIPETSKTNSIRLYKAIDFPTKWSFIGTMITGSPFRDSSIFRAYDKWWMFTCPTPNNDILLLYCANELLGRWTEHSKSPVVERDANIARPGGRVLVFNGQIIRYTQDSDPIYGGSVRAFEIIELTPENYQEKEVKENPILKGKGFGWNAERIHHIDPHIFEGNKWIVCVDGSKEVLAFSFGY